MDILKQSFRAACDGLPGDHRRAASNNMWISRVQQDTRSRVKTGGVSLHHEGNAEAVATALAAAANDTREVIPPQLHPLLDIVIDGQLRYLAALHRSAVAQAEVHAEQQAAAAAHDLQLRGGDPQGVTSGERLGHLLATLFWGMLAAAALAACIAAIRVDEPWLLLVALPFAVGTLATVRHFGRRLLWKNDYTRGPSTLK